MGGEYSSPRAAARVAFRALHSDSLANHLAGANAQAVLNLIRHDPDLLSNLSQRVTILQQVGTFQNIRIDGDGALPAAGASADRLGSPMNDDFVRDIQAVTAAGQIDQAGTDAANVTEQNNGAATALQNVAANQIQRRLTHIDAVSYTHLTLPTILLV